MASQGNGGTSGMHQRVMFFEFVAGVRLFKDGISVIKAQFKDMGANFAKVSTGMTADNKAALDKITAAISEAQSKQAAGLEALSAKNKEILEKKTADEQVQLDKSVAANAEWAAKLEAEYAENADARIGKLTEAIADENKLQAGQRDAFIAEWQSMTEAQAIELAKQVEQYDAAQAKQNQATRSKFDSGELGGLEMQAALKQQQDEHDALVALAEKTSTDVVNAKEQEMVKKLAIQKQESDGVIAELTRETESIKANALQQIETVRATGTANLAALEASFAQRLSITEANLAKEEAAYKAAGDANIANMKKQQAELEATSSAWTRLGGAIGIVGNLLKITAVGVGIFSAGLIGLFSIFKSLTEDVANWTSTIAEASEATGISTGVVQVAIEGLEKFGVSNQIATTTLTRFTKAVQEHSAALANLGITGVDVGGKYAQMWATALGVSVDQLNAQGIALSHDDIALMQFADGLSHATDKTAYFSQVVGGTIRSGSLQDIIAFFDKGSQGIASFGQAMQDAGFFMDPVTIKLGVLAQAINDQMSQALEGLKMRLGAAIMPDLEAMELIITSLISPIKDMGKGVSDTSTALQGFAQWLGHVTGVLFGFIGGLMGVDMKTLNAALKQAADDMQVVGASADNAANDTATLQQQLTALQQSIKDLEKETQLQTEALDNQITVLQRNQKAFDDGADDKLAALQAQKTAYEDQLKILDDLHQSYLAQLEDEETALKNSVNNQRQSGEDLATYETRLAENQLQTQINTETDKRSLISDTMQQNIDQLSNFNNLAKQAYDDNTANQEQALQDQKTALQDNLTTQEAANQTAQQDIQNQISASSSANTNSVSVSAKDITAAMTTAMTNIDGAISGSLMNGQNFRKELGDIFSDPAGTLTTAATTFGESIGKNLIQGVGDFLGGEGGLLLEKAVLEMMNAGWWNSIPLIGGFIKSNTSGALLDQVNKQIAQDEAAQAQGKAMPSPYNAGQGVASLFPVLSGPGEPGPATIAPHPGRQSANGGIFSSPTLTWVGETYEPEAIVPLNRPARAAEIMQAAGLTGGAGAPTFVTHFNGPVATTAVAGQVIDRFQREASRSGLIANSGVG